MLNVRSVAAWTRPFARQRGEALPLYRGVFKSTDAYCSSSFEGEEALETNNSSPHPPRRLPELLMIACEADANLGIQLEAAVGSEHHDGGRAEGVLGGEQYTEMVESALELRTRGSSEGTVPFLLQVRLSASKGVYLCAHEYIVL